jgi:hypothetical protein
MSDVCDNLNMGWDLTKPQSFNWRINAQTQAESLKH